MVIVVVVVELMCIVGGLVSIVLGLLHLLFIDRLQLTSCAVAMVTSGVTGSTVSVSALGVVSSIYVNWECDTSSWGMGLLFDMNVSNADVCPNLSEWLQVWKVYQVGEGTFGMVRHGNGCARHLKHDGFFSIAPTWVNFSILSINGQKWDIVLAGMDANIKPEPVSLWVFFRPGHIPPNKFMSLAHTATPQFY